VGESQTSTNKTTVYEVKDQMNIAEFKTKLLTEKEELEKSIAYLKKSDPSLDKNAADSGGTLDDDITEIEGHDRITATRLQMKQSLADVEGALERIEKGTFGKCSVGGEPISEERLQAMPTATVCLKHTK